MAKEWEHLVYDEWGNAVEFADNTAVFIPDPIAVLAFEYLKPLFLDIQEKKKKMKKKNRNVIRRLKTSNIIVLSRVGRCYNYHKIYKRDINTSVVYDLNIDYVKTVYQAKKEFKVMLKRRFGVYSPDQKVFLKKLFYVNKQTHG